MKLIFCSIHALHRSGYPGYEPDLTKEPKQIRKNTNKARRSRDKKRILGKKVRDVVKFGVYLNYPLVNLSV